MRGVKVLASRKVGSDGIADCPVVGSRDPARAAPFA